MNYEKILTIISKKTIYLAKVNEETKTNIEKSPIKRVHAPKL